jgi:hypothetical protein
MKSKLSLYNQIGAVLLTVVVIPALFISFFTVPFEFVIFEPASYYSILENDAYKEDFPRVVSEIITDQLLNIGENKSPAILENEESLKTILTHYLPEEWMNGIFKDVIDKVMAYLNFKTPYTSIEVNIVDLKNALIINSFLLSDEYLLSLDNCTVEENSALEGKEIIDLYTLPICKPSAKNRKVVSSALSMMVEDKANQLPASINLIGVIPGGMILGDKSFYYYSITRWIFRLLPFVTLILLIFIAYLLRKNKKIMRRWSGLILTTISALTLIGLLVILIGFDQFIGLIFNRYFSQVIAGFGYVLLGMIQNVGNQVLLWVIAVSGSALLLGLVLLLSARFTKSEDNLIKESEEEGIPYIESDALVKEIIPETIEEIEKQEKIAKEEKKKG